MSVNKKNILVVEDEPAIAETISYALQSDGFTPIVQATGEAALRVFSELQPIFVVLDIGLPDQSGIEVCKKLRKESNVPILFLSARDAEVDRVVGLEIGADDYLTKPFSPRELVARVKAILRRSAAGESEQDAQTSGALQTTGTVSPFNVDESRRVITYFGSKLDLARYEFKLLSVLISRPGWVFSREKLMDMVWDEPDSSMERTIDTHVKSIRSQLRAINPDFDPIVTHRGVGYALQENW